MMLWQKTKEILQEKIPPSIYTLWIEPLECTQLDESKIVLTGPDRFFCTWVAEKYLQFIEESLAEAGTKGLTVRFNFGAGTVNNPLLPGHEGKEQLRLPSIPRNKATIRTLNPRYTFDEFMVGDTNALAQSACRALAENDSSVGRCLFLQATTGLGKSHLSHSVAHYIVNNAPGTRLHYLTAQQLTAEMVRGIKSNTMEDFKDKYHKHCDVLLVEDVHALNGRTKTQAELAEVLDVLLEEDKRVIFTSAIPAKDIPNINQGFRSRLSSGLVTSINPPDFKTRILIIRRKAKNSGLDLSEEFIQYMAENIKGDIRQLESAIVGIKAKKCLLNMEPDFHMVKEVVNEIVGGSQELSVEVIRDFIARQFKVSVHEIQSKSRKKAIAFPRQVTMYMARRWTNHALVDIGRAVNRDHSTVVHSIRVITEAIARKGSVRGQIDHLTKKMKDQLL